MDWKSVKEYPLPNRKVLAVVRYEEPKTGRANYTTWSWPSLYPSMNYGDDETIGWPATHWCEITPPKNYSKAVFKEDARDFLGDASFHLETGAIIVEKLAETFPEKSAEAKELYQNIMKLVGLVDDDTFSVYSYSQEFAEEDDERFDDCLEDRRDNFLDR